MVCLTLVRAWLLHYEDRRAKSRTGPKAWAWTAALGVVSTRAWVRLLHSYLVGEGLGNKSRPSKAKMRTAASARQIPSLRGRGSCTTPSAKVSTAGRGMGSEGLGVANPILARERVSAVEDRKARLWTRLATQAGTWCSAWRVPLLRGCGSLVGSGPDR